jgi:hypothetical protein
VLPSDSLSATLTATVDSVVTLTLTVSNPSSVPVEVGFPSGQRYDFVVRSAATGASVWRWSADKLFAQALGHESIPAKGTITYSQRWTPTARGDFQVEGLLTSLSHRVSASTGVTVP